jgi:hypothetical protein
MEAVMAGGMKRFLKWMFSTKPAGELLTDEEKETYSSDEKAKRAKKEAREELEKEYSGQATPTPTATASPTPGRK